MGRRVMHWRDIPDRPLDPPEGPSHIKVDCCGATVLVEETIVIGNYFSDRIGCSECVFRCDHCKNEDYDGDELGDKMLCSSCIESAYLCEVCNVYIAPDEPEGEWYPFCSEKCCDSQEAVSNDD